MKLDFKQIDLVVGDMEATLAFYRALGVDIPEDAIWRTPSGAHHVDLTMPGGMVLHFDSAALARIYNRGWVAPTESGSRNVFTFNVESREDVDRIHDRLVSLNYRSSQPPYDTFWGSRYAIINDPDGNNVGVMSPSEPDRRSPPPDI
jgi:uncharacterized glyoxalase superfamily protein PhnB